MQCDKRFTTFERVELNMPVVVKKMAQEWSLTVAS